MYHKILETDVARKGYAFMREYGNISDEELKDICFVNADKEYITNVIEDAKGQYANGRFIEVIKNGVDQP